MNFSRFLACLLLLAPTFTPTLGSAPATPEQRALIAANVPREAPATPAKPRRLLIYTETKGFRHASIEVGVEAITLMGQRTGAYTATAAATPEVFTAEALQGYDAVLFLNTTGNLFQEVEARSALLDFVKNGGGIAGIHSATDTCYDWPEWGQMMGGYFDGHPWTSDFHVTLTIEEPEHPLNASFGGARSFFVQDEIYQLKDPYSRKTHRVLTSLDPRRAQFDHPTIAPRLKRDDRDYAVTQIREYGKGRIFYCSLGHNHHIYWNPAVMGHYLAGLQWVMGDLNADATPRPRAPLPPLASDDALYETAARTGFTDTQLPFAWLDDAIAEAGTDPAVLSDIERRLIALLLQPETTPAARQASAQRLGRVIPANPPRGRASLAALAPLLRSDNVVDVDLARLALEPVTGAAVDELFVEALKAAKGAAHIALIQAVGQRRQANAVATLAEQLRTNDPAITSAAAHALGSIGNARAAAALARSSGADVAGARLEAAGHLKGRAAARIYSTLWNDKTMPEPVRTGALRGLIEAEPSRAVARLLETLASGTPAQKGVALEAVATLGSRDVVPKLARAMSTFDAETQIALLSAFARRGENGAAVKAAIAASESSDATVRLAAISALGHLQGTAEVVGRLAEMAAGGGDPGRAAAASLSILRGAGVAEAVMHGARSAEERLRPTYVRQLALRGTADALPILFSLKSDAALPVRLAALESLDLLAPASGQAGLLAWSLGATEPAERTRAVRALITVTLRDPDTGNRTRPLVAALDNGGRDAQLLLIPAFVRLSDAPVLAAAVRFVRSSDPAVSRTALDVLSRWPDAAAIEALITHAEDPATGPAARATAAQAATRHYERAETFPKDQRSALVARLLKVTSDESGQSHLLLLLSRCADEHAMAIAREYVAVPALAPSAKDALDSIRANALGPPELRASGAGNRLAQAIDGRPETYWTVAARAGQWLQIDFKQTRPLRRLTLSQGSRRNEFPAYYTVQVTDDLAAPGAVVMEGAGTRDATLIEFPPATRGRYVIVRQTADRAENPNWSVAEISID